MESISADVAIVGAGGAGLRAAIALAAGRSRLRIALVSKVYPMRSHTCAAEGGAAGVIKPDDSLEQHFNDTVGGGDWLCDQDAVEYFVERSARGTDPARALGLPVEPRGGRLGGGAALRRHEDRAHLVRRRQDRASTSCTRCSRPRCKYPRSSAIDEYYVTELLVEDGRCRGLTAIEMRSGQMRRFDARAVISHAAAPAACSRSPPTARSRPATAWRSPTARACRSRTWSSCSTTRPACRAPACC